MYKQKQNDNINSEAKKMRLKELRKQRNENQTAIANYLQLTQRAISSYEQGKTEPDLKTIKKIADYFNVSLDYLLERPFRQIELSGASEKQKELIKEILELDDTAVETVNAFIQGLKSRLFTQTRRTEWNS